MSSRGCFQVCYFQPKAYGKNEMDESLVTGKEYSYDFYGDEGDRYYRRKAYVPKSLVQYVERFDNLSEYQRKSHVTSDQYRFTDLLFIFREMATYLDIPICTECDIEDRIDNVDSMEEGTLSRQGLICKHGTAPMFPLYEITVETSFSLILLGRKKI